MPRAIKSAALFLRLKETDRAKYNHLPKKKPAISRDNNNYPRKSAKRQAYFTSYGKNDLTFEGSTPLKCYYDLSLTDGKHSIYAIENNDFETAQKYAKQYALQFGEIDSLILGCTHYPLLKTFLRQCCGDNTKIISQDELMGKKLKDYLFRHIEIDICLSRNNELKILVSQDDKKYREVAKYLFPNIMVEKVTNNA